MEYIIEKDIVIICLHVRYSSAHSELVANLLIQEIKILKLALKDLSYKLCIVGDINHLPLHSFMKVHTVDDDVVVATSEECKSNTHGGLTLGNVENVLFQPPPLPPKTLFASTEVDNSWVIWLASCIRDYFDALGRGILPTDHDSITVRIDGIDIMVVGLAGVANGKFAVWPLLMNALYGLLRKYKKSINTYIEPSVFREMTGKIKSIAQLAVEQFVTEHFANRKKPEKPYLFELKDYHAHLDHLRRTVNSIGDSDLPSDPPQG